MTTSATRSPTAALASALVGLALASACERPAGTPSRVPGDGMGAVLSVPYPMVEAERIEGAGRATLAQARLVHVSLGAVPDDREHALPERMAWDGAFVVAHHVEPVGAATSTWQALRRLAFGRAAPERGRAVPVEAAEVEALGLQPPAETVWLVGPRGSCRATVGGPLVGAYDGALDTVMVGYRLDGCAGRAWAQVGIVADAIPVDFRWVPAEASPEVLLPHGRRWDDPLASQVEPPAWSPDDAPRQDLVWLREIPGVSPRVLQLRYARLGARTDEAAADPGSWCTIDAAWTRTDGWWNGRWIDAVPFPPDAVDPFLLGAFVNGTQVDAVIYDDRFDALVVIPPSPLADVDDPSAWQATFVPTGSHDAATLATWGVEPARGPLPVGPACDVEAAPDEPTELALDEPAP